MNLPNLELAAHARHSPPRMGNSRTARHARAAVLQPSRLLGGRRRGHARAFAAARFGAAHRRSAGSGQRQTWYPWPYVEGLTMAEATNELAFLVTGAYGKPVSKQMGAPLRLAVPWKYGFKSIKSIVRFNFTDQRPKSFWEALQASEYGFWANVNPQVSHPRWSQATEELIGQGERRPTLLFNGYDDYVAGLYQGLEKERLWA